MDLNNTSFVQYTPPTFPRSLGPSPVSWFTPIIHPNGTTSTLSGPSVNPDQSIVSSMPVTVTGALILGLVFLLGVPGNLFVIWSVLARARRRSVTTLLILHLACADGLLMALTAFFVVYLVRSDWEFGAVLCKLLFYLCCANMYASIALITLMSLHRLLAVTRPQSAGAKASRGTVLKLLVGVWVLVLALSVPVLVYRKVKEYPNSEGGVRHVCEPEHQPRDTVLQYTMETVLGFVLPYSAIIASYVCILRRIRKTRFRRRIRSEKLILTIVITFGIFWLPYHVINMIQVAAALAPEKSPLQERLNKFWKTGRTLTSTLAFISSSVNPLLYTFAGKSYMRREGLGFMARLFEATGRLEASRKSRQNSRESRDKDKKAKEALETEDDDGEEGTELRESESTTSAHANTHNRVSGQQSNGK
ncbi:leukotriene B4 receptor 2a isoform X1 [Alosa pseudoharengus]|uniref:leukotriene B4 receptor 2a isoform X1 n=1 Tax=Alosa pseudoharengus TaxID=34774 RepID=UPI003F8A817F